MNSIETLTVFFGWCTVINIGILVVMGIVVMIMRNWMITMHSKMFGVDEAELPRLYFQYLAIYYVGILFLNLAPYIALKLIV